MMAQYHAVKARYPDCLMFYRMGDFYELFFDDAISASETLDITLTKRGKTQGDEIPMCGVPFHSYEGYLAKLIRAGFKVAICEQTETPEQAKKRGGYKALVNRDVVRVVTPGTLTEDALLEPRENNYLAAVADAAGEYGLAWLDLSTGDFMVQPCTLGNIAAALSRLNPGEIVVPERLNGEYFSAFKTQTTLQSNSLFDSSNAQKRLQELYGLSTLDSLGTFTRAEIAAAGSLVDYVRRTQAGKLPRLSRLRRMTSQGTMDIDAATRRNLELTRTLSGDRKGSLLDALDRCMTAAGSRLLLARLSSPLTDIDSINARLDEIDTLLSNAKFRNAVRETLRGMPDMERALSRLTLGRGGPRDMGQIRDGLAAAEKILALLNVNASAALNDIAAGLKQNDAVKSLADRLTAALSDDLPFLERDGGFIRTGYAPEIDRLRTLRDESRQHIAKLQQSYRDKTGIDTLKISYNNVLGYFIDVTTRHADKMMVQRGQVADNDNPFIHRQTLANNVRFTTPELSELERDLSAAAEKSIAIELDYFAKFAAVLTERAEDILTLARAAAALDVAAALADLAATQNYTRPLIDNSTAFDIKGGRHPVVENALKKTGQPFIGNDCDLSPAQRLWLLTGPNMAGKSTFLRQNAVIAILAQMGSFVPANSAHIGIIDRLFSRVGAADDLARGHSTFMVEMVETAVILNQATNRSLVILDEIGRGTSTFDGLSIAWACVEQLHEVNQCRGLFATHYHELTSLTDKLPALSCHSMQVKEWKGDIVFLHSVAAGSADRSYGIHVARLAGIPPAVIERAKTVLESLQNKGDKMKVGADLPLFTAAPSAAKTSPVEDRIKSINPDALSAKEALDIIYELKKII